ncbi:MAG: S8 family serine peptidase [Candidatus Aenigmatarchaeota archaeon]
MELKMKRIVLIGITAMVLILSGIVIATNSKIAERRIAIASFEDKLVPEVTENLKPNKDEFVQDEIIVKFEGDVKPFRVIKVPEGRVGEKVREYLKRRDVIYAEPNYIAYAQMVPNDPYYKYQWHLDNAKYGGIQMEEAWDITTGDNSVIVAILDTGIAYENYKQGRTQYCKAPDLANTCFVQGYDFVNGDTHPNDDNSHGTHVAGTLAQSTNNKLGVAGIAFNTCLMPIKVLDRQGSGSYANIAAGIRYAVDNGAKVISLSLGGSSDSATLKDAVKYAYEKGATVIAACGNDNMPICLYPAAYDDYVIAVGATQYDETKAPYSNYGPSLDLVAPGGNNNLDQNQDGYADGVLQQTFKNSRSVCSFAYYFFQGTSMAVPHVSGIAALLIANGNAVTPNEVRAALQETAKDLGSVGWDNIYGYGLVNAYAALRWRFTPECTADSECNDGLYCNGAEVCVNGVCKAGTQVDCSMLSDQCNIGVCDETNDQCIAQPKADGTACDDGQFCTVGETCQAGICKAIQARSCDDSNPCTIDSCDEVNDVCVNAWPDCGISDGCCGPACTYATDPDCLSFVKCWSAEYKYLYRANGQAAKFCKCAQGLYGYRSYASKFARVIAYRYLDTGDNEKWEVASRSSNLPIYQVICKDGKTYPTNKDYYYPKTSS